MQEALTAVIGLLEMSPVIFSVVRGAEPGSTHLPSTWQLRDFPSQSGVLSLILLNGFPMNLSS